MPEYDLAIRGGTVVTATDTIRADIGVRDGRIAAVADRLADAARTIDASGLLVLPGGIDSHVHIAQPSGPGIVMADDFASATRAAAAGGNTCVMPFALQPRGQSLRETALAYRALAEGQCHIDVAIHLIVSDPTPAVLGQELPAMIGAGFTSFKVFMTYDDLVLNDRQILDVFDVARREGARVMVHAEGYDAIRYMTERMERSGQTGPYGHALSRPQTVEREAAHRAISHAELVDLPIVIVHVSGGEAMEQIAWAQERGMKIHAETCPQYLTLTAEDMKGLGQDDPLAGSKYVCSPPVRDTASQEQIWSGIQRGVFDVVSSDHCPFRYDETGKRNPKGRTSFRWIPNGIPGIETRLPILFSEGVSKGRISLNRFVALSATNHAKLYGLYPRKGSIGPGFDADLTLWDPNRREVIRQEILHHGADYTPWEGFAVTGWPVMTIAGGSVIVEDGRILEEPGRGRVLDREIDRTKLSPRL
ncbi:dihydropyrimidinase [Methylobacterium gnaphalii]|uniref:Dihydropyrimidinase n=1 Tax=Methylobacterium gnaphalii TaxID=1010610 RepID=A0A512JMH2_9HYPH|nr:dihydropyrimidinase [Methylobacterium gnaphalii]GEP11169.1 dihydropyrimidinase [Methylobacterium gnaphalii]GJD70039.1 D-hydantoinase [Methylobacterium gnaphalii]GLS49674.1 dihydropyrimidinase [Methylobacterium gnaphalii]